MTGEVTKKNNPFFRQLLYIAVLVGIGLVIFKQLNFFVGSFLGAITIYVVLRNWMFRLVEKYGWRKWLASLLLVLSTTVVIGGLGYLLIFAVSSEIPNINLHGLLSGMNDLPAKLNGTLGMEIIPHDIIQRSNGIITKLLSSILNTTYSFATNIVMMLIILYFMLTSGRKMEERIWAYAPFSDKSLSLIKKEVKTMIYSNAVGMPVILIAQTLVSSLIYWQVGFQNFFFWGFLTAICGLIPVLGTALVYVPVSIYLALTDQLGAGVILIAYGVIIISNTDNVLRIILMKKVVDTHPLVVIFGVILGIPLFGFWGIIFGPLLISGFLLLIKIYYMEYGLMEHPSEEELSKPRVKKVPRHLSKIAQKADEISARSREKQAAKVNSTQENE